MRSDRTAQGSRGGALPGRVGADLVREVMSVLGYMEGVTVTRNPVMRVRLPSGGFAWTGIGGEGAPDVHAEIRTVQGVNACVWLECKSGTGDLTPVQQRWHDAAARTGRHCYVVRSVADAIAFVRIFLVSPEPTREAHRGR